MTRRNPIPAVNAAAVAYERNKADDALRILAAAAAAPWNFTQESLPAGVELVRRMPYNYEAVEWSARFFDDNYEMAWWPVKIPALIVSGSEDRIVTQSLWDEQRFRATNVHRALIEGGAHFPWVERPDAVRAAFSEFAGFLARAPGNPWRPRAALWQAAVP
jgi:pimeloyl-ACP methyl ester carboxylesterase